MINNESTLFAARTATSNHHADQISVTQSFYDRIRSDFLQQSARYLGASLSRNQIESRANKQNPLHA